MGADLVGKLEQGIPEDDPRNPGVIADNVGDNVGDVAGMGADIFESYVGSNIAAIAIASTMTAEVAVSMGGQGTLMFLPLALSAAGLLASLLGIAIVQILRRSASEKALGSGVLIATLTFMGFAGLGAA